MSTGVLVPVRHASASPTPANVGTPTIVGNCENYGRMARSTRQLPYHIKMNQPHGDADSLGDACENRVSRMPWRRRCRVAGAALVVGTLLATTAAVQAQACFCRFDSQTFISFKLDFLMQNLFAYI